MTIIAVRDGIMAVDSLVSRDDSIIGQIKKWREVPEFHGGGFIAGSGKISEIVKFLDDFKKIGTDGDSDIDSNFIHLKADGSIWKFDNGWFQFETEYYACGFGRREAMGALAQGATAEEAVRVVCSFVDSCGGEIYVLKI